jgi:hypothetical protein
MTTPKRIPVRNTGSSPVDLWDGRTVKPGAEVHVPERDAAILVGRGGWEFVDAKSAPAPISPEEEREQAKAASAQEAARLKAEREARIAAAQAATTSSAAAGRKGK